MKKFILLAAALLLAAVFMSGCVAGTDDPIVGEWCNHNQFDSPYGPEFMQILYVFNEDGTGMCLARFVENAIYGQIDLTWKNIGDGKYEITRLDTKGSNFPTTSVMEIKDGNLYMETSHGMTEYHPASTAKYLEGLWISDRNDYKDNEQLKSMMYLSADGTGFVMVFGQTILGVEDAFVAEIAWVEKDGKITSTGSKGKSGEFVLENGVLKSLNTDGTFHKYTVEDHLYGLWMSETQYVENGVTYDIVTIWRDNGTGKEFYTIPDSHKASEVYNFTWKKVNSHTYEAAYEDGEVLTFTAENLNLVDGDGTVYSKIGMQTLAEFADQVTA